MNISNLKLFLNKYEIYIVLIFLFIFVTFYSCISYNKVLNLDSALFDQGLQEQVIWNTSNFRLFQSSPEVENFLGDHFSPSLILISIIYKILPFTLTLIILQALGIAIGILGFYLIAKKKLENNDGSDIGSNMNKISNLSVDCKPKSLHFDKCKASTDKHKIYNFWPLIIFFILLIYRPLAGALLFQFHEIAFAFPFLVFGILALENKKLKIALILLFIAIGFKEDVSIFVGCLGFYYGFFRNQKWGYILFVFCVIYALSALKIFIPYFRGEQSDTISRYPSLFNNTNLFIDNLFNRDKLRYLFVIFLPVIGLIFAFPEACVLVIPSLMVNLLSITYQQYLGELHYNILISVAVFYSLILGIEKMQNLTNKPLKLKQSNINIFYKSIKIIVIVLMIIGNAKFLTSNTALFAIKHTPNRTQDRKNLISLMKTLPKDKNITVSNNIGGYFAKYPHIYSFHPKVTPVKKVKYDYIVIDCLTYKKCQEMQKSTEYTKIQSKGNIVIYKSN